MKLTKDHVAVVGSTRFKLGGCTDLHLSLLILWGNCTWLCLSILCYYWNGVL